MFKKSLPLILSLLTTTAYAITIPGSYAGFIIGEGYTNYTASTLGVPTSRDINTGIAGGIFGGYQFNNLIGGEIDFIRFPEATFSNINNVTGLTGRIKESAIEFLLKGTTSISNLGFNITDMGFTASAKFGGAILYPRTENLPSNSTAPDSARVRPVFGLGLGYEITPFLPIEISWTRIQSESKTENADLIGLILSYSFC